MRYALLWSLVSSLFYQNKLLAGKCVWKIWKEMAFVWLNVCIRFEEEKRWITIDRKSNASSEIGEKVEYGWTIAWAMVAFNCILFELVDSQTAYVWNAEYQFFYRMHSLCILISIRFESHECSITGCVYAVVDLVSILEIVLVHLFDTWIIDMKPHELDFIYMH